VISAFRIDFRSLSHSRRQSEIHPEMATQGEGVRVMLGNKHLFINSEWLEATCTIERKGKGETELEKIFNSGARDLRGRTWESVRNDPDSFLELSWTGEDKETTYFRQYYSKGTPVRITAGTGKYYMKSVFDAAGIKLDEWDFVTYDGVDPDPSPILFFMRSKERLQQWWRSRPASSA